MWFGDQMSNHRSQVCEWTYKLENFENVSFFLILSLLILPISGLRADLIHKDTATLWHLKSYQWKDSMPCSFLAMQDLGILVLLLQQHVQDGHDGFCLGLCRGLDHGLCHHNPCNHKEVRYNICLHESPFFKNSLAGASRLVLMSVPDMHEIWRSYKFWPCFLKIIIFWAIKTLKN